MTARAWGNRREKAAPGALRTTAVFAVTAVALVALFVAAVNTGTLKVSPDQLFRGLFVAYDDEVATVFDLRFPRIFIAMLGGAATAASGALLQASIRNPLADPGIIGINAGAEFAALIVVALFPQLVFFSPAFAFVGGLAAYLLVFSLSWRGGLSPLRIILVGIAVNATLTGLMSAFNAGTGSNLSGVASLVNANISMKTWGDLQTLAPYALVGMVLALVAAKRCDLLLLEDKTARSLGVDVDKSRLAVSAVAVLLAAASCAVVGPVSFLGLIAPHIGRILVGTRHRVLLPYSMLFGALLLLAADTIGRTVAAPYEISAAVIMAIVGGPAFIVLLRKARIDYGS